MTVAAEVQGMFRGVPIAVMPLTLQTLNLGAM